MDPHRTSVKLPTTANSTQKLERDPDQPVPWRTAHAHVHEVALGIPGVAHALGIGRPLAERLLASGAVRVHVIGQRKFVLRADLARWLAERDASEGGIR
jgi:hypothetical protein